MITEFATMSDGARIVYRLHKGSGDARFVLVHSLAMDNSFWNAVIAHLKDTGDVLTYDCRGHGQSTKSPGPYTGDLFARDLAELFGEVGWGTAIIAGASMGGCISLAFADLYPEKVAGLGLIDTTAWYGADAPEKWEERAAKARTKGLAALVEFQKTRWVSESFRTSHPEIVDAAIATFLANDIDAYVQTCGMMGAFDRRSALPRITAKTTILVGSEDYAAPVAMSEAMHAGIKNAKLTVIDGVRHLTPLECPELVAGALRELAV